MSVDEADGDRLRSEGADSVDLESTFQLVERTRAGDQEALERLFARHLKPLQRWASGRLPKWARDLADTDDLIQETLLQTFKRIENFEPRRVGALQAYLRQAVLNRIRNELRRKGRQPHGTDLDAIEVESAESPLEQAIGSEAERY
jgi:RNA polymerase sigma factor (sigma-70 family)